MTTAYKVKERFLRRCHKRRIWEAWSESRSNRDPIHILFWRDGREARLLNVMPSGDIVQRADHHETSTGIVLYDPHNLSCYERWFWQEMEGVAKARRMGATELAFIRIRTARRLRQAQQRATEIQHLEAAE